MLKIEGLDQLERKLKDLEQRAKQLDGTHDISFAELFPDAFMHRYTDFMSMQIMLDAAGIEQADDINKEEWSAFVAQKTQFSSWDEMRGKAGAEWAASRLGF